MAPVEESVEESVPAQWRPQTLYDFRGMPDGPRGYKVGVTKKGRLGSKRKLDDYSKQVRALHLAWHDMTWHAPWRSWRRDVLRVSWYYTHIG